MYTPSMFFGGSSLIHLLASHPRVVAFFGISALVGSLLSPFGTPDVMGTAGYVKQLEQVARQHNAIDPSVVARAHKAAGVLAQLPESRITEIVGATLRECGAACVGIHTTEVFKNRELLTDLLLLYTLNQANAQNTAARVRAASAAATEVTQ